MDSAELTELNLNVSVSGATEEEIDRMTRQLLSELRQLDVESAEMVRGGDAPSGSKGDPVTIGSIALAVLPSTLPNVIALVQDWIARQQGRTVEFEGRGIKFKGPPEAFQKALDALAARKAVNQHPAAAEKTPGKK